VELNEFNLELARSLAETHGLPNLRRVLGLPHTTTTTRDREETGFLEPWVQWVSIHTGTESAVHGIRHLGDVDKLGEPQVWERLSEQGVSSGAWGVMNATRGDAPRCRFFLPDPWTFSEPGHPAPLEDLLALPRYAARNYLHLSRWRAVRLGGRFLRALLTAGITLRLLAELPALLRALARFGPKHFVLISFFDYASTLLFLRYKRRYDPALTLIFLNSLAHAQHHHWTRGTEGSTAPLEFAYRYADRCLGLLLDALQPDEALLVMNGLSQMNTNHETSWVLYRPYDPERFLEALGIDFSSNQQLMTHDSHLFLESPEACARARARLSEVTVEGEPLFVVEPDPKDACRLFYRVDFSRETGDDSRIDAGGLHLRFLDWLCPVVVRTGRHVPRGDAFAQGLGLPEELPNHEVIRYVLAHLAGEAERADAPRRAAALP
jgi:hypothetical protein